MSMKNSGGPPQNQRKFSNICKEHCFTKHFASAKPGKLKVIMAQVRFMKSVRVEAMK
jgi:hypothetical protein